MPFAGHQRRRRARPKSDLRQPHLPELEMEPPFRPRTNASKLGSARRETEMDGYPQDLEPRGIGTAAKEGFSAWWVRARDSFPTVPRNVARQWLHRHWGQSRFPWLPSHGTQFTLEFWQPAQVAALKSWHEGTPPYVDWGDDLLADAAKPKLYRTDLASIMNRHHRWPAPPIVWHRAAPLANEPVSDLPIGFVLVEGNRRVAMAKALERRGLLLAQLPHEMRAAARNHA